MHIAFIGQKGVNIGERGGGIEAHVGILARKLAERGHDITAYARSEYGEGQPDNERITARFIPTVYRKNFEAIIHTFLSTIDALFQPYDIIHYHGVGPSTLAWIPRLFKPSCKVVTTFHSQDRFHRKWNVLARMYLYFGEWATCWFSDVTIAVSHVIQVLARDKYKRQVVYIPNGAELHNVTATDELEQFDLEPNKYLVNVSRLVPHKGQHYLIEAFQNLQAEHPDLLQGFKLVLVGSPSYTGEYLERLEAMSADNPNVIMTGYQSGDTLKQLFTHAYLYVQPSESEGLAVVVLEAMSFGTPVLVSDIPENLEAMHHAGFSFKNADVADLTDKLHGLIQHPDVVENKAKQVRNVVRTDFNWNTIAEHTESVYRSIRH